MMATLPTNLTESNEKKGVHSHQRANFCKRADCLLFYFFSHPLAIGQRNYFIFIEYGLKYSL